MHLPFIAYQHNIFTRNILNELIRMDQPAWPKVMQANIQDHTSQLIDNLKKEILNEFTLKTHQQKTHIDLLQ